MEYRNELLDGLVGGPVIVGLIKAPEITEEAAEKMRADPMAGKSELAQTLSVSYELVSYDGLGLTLRALVPGEEPFFVPWSAVLKIRGGFEDHEDFIG